jgi:hypothetical protein
VQERRQPLHDTQTVPQCISSAACFKKPERESSKDLHRDGEREPHGEHGDEERDSKDALHLECALDGHVPQHFGELRMSE